MRPSFIIGGELNEIGSGAAWDDGDWLVVDAAGVLTLTSFVSPYRADRDGVRALHDAAGLPFVEVFIDTPIDLCEQRDPKGLYKKARAGELKGFTGIDDPYEAPVKPELVLKPATMSVEDSVAACLDLLRSRSALG